MRHSTPSLSTVLATAHPGAPLDALLERLLPQLAEVGGELVLADSSLAGLTTPRYEGVAVTHLRRPGADVFAMRAEGVREARGWVVAFAEDHCMPADDRWATSVLDAHRRHGDRAAVTGAIRNGTTRTPWDRGSYLLTFAAVSEPLADGRWANQAPPPPANVSIKRESLAAYELPAGFLEFELLPHLSRVSHIATAPTARMEHHQSHSLGWFVVHHFHNGRATGGLHPPGAGTDRIRRALGSIALPFRHLRRIRRELHQRPGGLRGHRTAVAFMAMFLVAHAAGQLCGVLVGPGHSPAALE